MKYRWHNENSRKGFVHLVFDLYGRDSALALGEHLSLANGTVSAWCHQWQRDDDDASGRGEEVASRQDPPSRAV